MSDLKPPVTSRSGPIIPPPPAVRGTGPVAEPRPGPPAAANDRNGVRSPTNPLTKSTPGVDMGELAHMATQLGQALDAGATVYDAAANTADAVVFAPDAIKQTFSKLPKAPPNTSAELGKAVERAQKAGRVLGVVGAGLAVRDLVSAVHPQLDMPAAAEAISNLALGVATAAEDMLKTPGANEALRTVGGVAGIAASLFALARNLKDIRENGMSWSAALGLLGNGLQAVGSALMLFPGTQVLAGAILMAGASLNLARLAVENWDTIKSAAQSATTKVGGWLSTAWRWATGPPDAAPTPAPT